MFVSADSLWKIDGSRGGVAIAPVVSRWERVTAAIFHNSLHYCVVWKLENWTFCTVWYFYWFLLSFVGGEGLRVGAFKVSLIYRASDLDSSTLVTVDSTPTWSPPSGHGPSGIQLSKRLTDSLVFCRPPVDVKSARYESSSYIFLTDSELTRAEKKTVFFAKKPSARGR